MSECTRDEQILRAWIGRSQTVTDVLDPTRARLMQATLDQQPTLTAGDALPGLWHWIYFWQGAPLSELGRDGHRKMGGFLPPVDLPRRMWAGSRFGFYRPLILGTTLTRTSTIRDVSVKQGRSGDLCFITTHHEITDDTGDILMHEEHDAVYREAPRPGVPAPSPPEPPAHADWSDVVTPSSVMLFRYSALTFNGHRIHYDRDYSREIEGYPGLVFHGPLTGTLLAGLGERYMAPKRLTEFSFRALAPLFDDRPFVIRGVRNRHTADELTLWAETPSGGMAMTATASFTGR